MIECVRRRSADLQLHLLGDGEVLEDRQRDGLRAGSENGADLRVAGAADVVARYGEGGGVDPGGGRLGGGIERDAGDAIGTAGALLVGEVVA